MKSPRSPEFRGFFCAFSAGMCFGDRGRCPNDALNVVSGGIRFFWSRLVQHHFSIKILRPWPVGFRSGACFFGGASELEPGGDPGQAGGILFHIVELRDLRGGVPQQVGHLPGGEGPEAAVRLLHPVDQVGGEGVAQGVEAPPLQPSRCQDAVVPFPEVYRPGVVAVFLIEVGGDVGGDFLLDLRLGAAAEGFSFLFSLLYFPSLESGLRRPKVIFLCIA